MGTSWISRKGGILEKGGGITPLTNYDSPVGNTVAHTWSVKNEKMLRKLYNYIKKKVNAQKYKLKMKQN